MYGGVFSCLLLAAALTYADGSSSGLMTMWSDSTTTIVGGSCEYANEANGGVNSPAATSPYISSFAYCAVDATLYENGANCGACYRVSYDGSSATDPGQAGSQIVQIVDSGSAKTFDCQLQAFQTITGSSTGVFPITYEPVDCETSNGGAVATMLDGDNAYFTKVIFSNLASSVEQAELTITPADGSSVSFSMDRAGGATWSKGGLGGVTGSASFSLTLASGNVVTMDSCFETWPVATNQFCTGGSSSGQNTGGSTNGQTPTQQETTSSAQKLTPAKMLAALIFLIGAVSA